MNAQQLVDSISTIIKKLKIVRQSLLCSFITKDAGVQLAPVEDLAVAQDRFNREVLNRIRALEGVKNGN